jgi:hypothetical protein
MTAQASLFDLDDARARRDAGAQVATDNTPTWSELAQSWISDQAPGTVFTSEDMTAALGLPRGGVGQHRNNAVGAAILAASRHGVIHRTGYTQSRRPESHAAVIAVWERAGNPW